MGLVSKLFGSTEQENTHKLFFATDLHGSNVCFKKFLNAGSFYDVDTLVLGGDLSGKAIVPVVEQEGGWKVIDDDGTTTVADGAEIEERETAIRNRGDYPKRMTPGELEEFRADDDKVDELYRELRLERLEKWEQWADERLDGIPVYAISGNDDHQYVVDELQQWEMITYIDGGVAELDSGHPIAGYGIANPTPWDTPREKPEESIREDLRRLGEKIDDWERTVLNVHCPPHETEIDEAPELNENLEPRTSGGEVLMQPVGSVAIREWISDNEPLLGLHGHIHEGQGEFELGSTLCLNPGSNYSESSLNGALVTLGEEKVIQHQFTSG